MMYTKYFVLENSTGSKVLQIICTVQFSQNYLQALIKSQIKELHYIVPTNMLI